MPAYNPPAVRGGRATRAVDANDRATRAIVDPGSPAPGSLSALTAPGAVTPSGRPEAPSPAEYNREVAAHAQAERAAISRAQPVRRGSLELPAAIVATVVSAPAEVLATTAAAIDDSIHAASAALERAACGRGFWATLARLFSPLAYVARAVGAVLRAATSLIALPFRGLAAACISVARNVAHERPVDPSRAEYARVHPQDWPSLPTNAVTEQRVRQYLAGPRCPYDVIIVPGVSGDDQVGPLSHEARARLAVAATDWRRGQAPFILVSGGNVHPPGTRYNEAYEMRRYLIEHGVPGDAILVEPHAQHTTENLRNSGRLMQRLGLSRGLVATSAGVVVGQSFYLQNADSPLYGFHLRSRLEAGATFGRLTFIDSAHTLFEPSADVHLARRAELGGGSLVDR